MSSLSHRRVDNRRSQSHRPGSRRSLGGGIPPPLGSSADAARYGRTITVPFRESILATFPNTATTVVSYRLSADNLGDRLLRLSDEYLMCRPHGMRLTMLSSFGYRDTSGGGDSHGFYAVSANCPITLNPPSGLPEMIDQPVFQVGPLAQPSQRVLAIPPAFFESRNLRWYTTRDAGDDEMWQFMELHVLKSTTFTPTTPPTLILIIEGSLQFRMPVDGDVNPLALQASGLSPRVIERLVARQRAYKVSIPRPCLTRGVVCDETKDEFGEDDTSLSSISVRGPLADNKTARVTPSDFNSSVPERRSLDSALVPHSTNVDASLVRGSAVKAPRKVLLWQEA